MRTLYRAMRWLLLAGLAIATIFNLTSPLGALAERFRQTSATKTATATVFLPTLVKPAAAVPISSKLRQGPVETPHLLSKPLGRPQGLPQSAASHVAAQITNPTLDAKVLVLATDGSEPSLSAITETLEYLATPYTVLYTAHAKRSGPLTAAQLADGSHSFYQGVILTNGELGYDRPDGSWGVDFTSAEWQTLHDYEAAFGLRQVTWYTYPSSDYGFGAASTLDPPDGTLPTTLTADGKTVFAYLNSATPVTINEAYTYLATPAANDSTGSVTPLLVDANGHALAAIKTYADKRQNLALTFDSNQYLIHSLELGYGLINWVTKGLFLGERHVYVSAQVDDYFIPDDIWTPQTPCGTNLDINPSGVEYRMSGNDVRAVATWQQGWQSQATTKNLILNMAFNGTGTLEDRPANDTLLPTTMQLKDVFRWINHTYDHELLTFVDKATTTTQLQKNNAVASRLQLPSFTRNVMVTPEISGLTNTLYLQAAYEQGIRYVVSDASKPNQNNPSPNVGIYNPLQPQILMIPRRANNLFYNVSQQNEWVAEYNCLYQSYWGRALTVNEIMDKESDLLVQYLLRGEIDPWMFHVTNLRAYDGTHTLLSDLIDRTLAKYNSYYTLPIKSPTMEVLGQTLADRMAFRTAIKTGALTVSIAPDPSVKTITLTAQQPVTVPVTGLYTANAELYGKQYISYITLNAGQTVTLPVQ